MLEPTTSAPDQVPATTPSDQVRQLMMGGWASQVVFVLAGLGIPDQLADGHQEAEAVADAAGTDPDATRRLLRAAATLGLVSEAGRGRYRLTELGECLCSDSSGSVREQALSWGTPASWRLCGSLGQAIRTGRPTTPDVLGGSFWEYFADHPDEGAQFSRAMGQQSAQAAADVAAAISPSGYRRIADIGGAHGDLLMALLSEAPQSRGLLVDLPQVIDGARQRVAGSPLAGRIELCRGDFFHEVPEADLYLLKWILHDWDDEQARLILSTCRRAAAPGARLLVVEMVLPDPWAPSPAHLFDLAMLTLLGGRERSEPEYHALLEAAGWSPEKTIPTPGRFTVLQAAAC